MQPLRSYMIFFGYTLGSIWASSGQETTLEKSVQNLVVMARSIKVHGAKKTKLGNSTAA